jgi:drug/metabolite transporter (DMT)-like permease
VKPGAFSAEGVVANVVACGTTWRSLLLGLGASGLVGAAQLVLKAVADGAQQQGWFDPGVLGLGFLGYGLLGVGFILFFLALRIGEVSTLYPVLAARYVWVLIAAPFFFPAESVNLLKLVGAVLAAVGVVIVARAGVR